MNTYLDCIPCFLRQSIAAARNVTDDTRIHEQVVQEILRLAADLDLNQTPPRVAQIIHRRLRELTGVADPYQAAKSTFNQLALSLLPKLRDQVTRSNNPLFAATKMAIAANVIDLGAKIRLDENQATDALLNSYSTDVIGDFAEFETRVGQARRILYLADNAGEIVIDRLLIEQLGPDRVTLVVRGKAIINDATIADAKVAELHTLVRVIDNGSDGPGTILDDCSVELKELFHNADLIIAKGQGNFETLSSETANIVFLFKVKCPVIAQHTSIPLNSHVLLMRGNTNR